jgi:hypothetical protein
MATIKGYDGSITAGGNAVGEVKNFSLDQSSDVVETTTLGSAWAKNTSTIKRWSGSLTAHFDIGDTGQDGLRSALSGGTTVALVLSLSGDTTYSGDAVVESISIANDVAGIVEASVSFTGTGALTEA